MSAQPGAECLGHTRAGRRTEQMLWLARELDDHTGGNETISLDWGRFSVTCSSGELKALLTDLARDYTRLKTQEIESAKAERDAGGGAGI